MIKLRLKSENVESHSFIEDINNLQKQLYDAGYSASKADIAVAWEQYSEGICAQWMGLSNYPESNINNILDYFEEEN